MKGMLLRFYVHENRKHHHILLYEWLLERVKKMGIHGGSAFRALAGFGRHGIVHEEHRFDLGSDLTVEIDFAVSDQEADQILANDRTRKHSSFLHPNSNRIWRHRWRRAIVPREEA